MATTPMNSFCVRISLILAASHFLILSAADGADKQHQSDRPNILIFIIDDLGAIDMKVDGSTFYETPHLDALARSGVRMTSFYSACPVCSPTRAALMTGKVPQRVGITDWIHPGSGVVLPSAETTLAETFQTHGYQTGYLGKWHLGEDDANLPTKHGFEWIKGVNRAGQPGSYHFPYKQSPDKPTVYDVPSFDDAKPSDYLTDVLTTGALEFLKQRDAKRPFLLCFGHYAVHTPIQPPKGLPEKYREKRSRLYGESTTPIVAAPNNSTSRGRQDDPDYAAMMENLDQNIGRVLNTLEESGLRKNTIVILTSDNGGLCTNRGQRPGPTCNLPLRSGKGWTYEGGIRIATYITWPDQLKPGVCDVPAYTVDFYPTLLDLCGLPLMPQQHLDGRSLVSALKGKPDASLTGRSIAWYYPHEHGSGHKPSAAIRRGAWKLIYHLDSKTSELYNLASDPSETTDVASSEPDRAKSLRDEVVRWIEETTKTN